MALPTRDWATPGDKSVRASEDNSRGWDPSPDAIGGYYGIQWWEHYEDAKTGEKYRVHCYDGVYGGKSAQQ